MSDLEPQVAEDRSGQVALAEDVAAGSIGITSTADRSGQVALAEDAAAGHIGITDSDLDCRTTTTERGSMPTELTSQQKATAARQEKARLKREAAAAADKGSGLLGLHDEKGTSGSTIRHREKAPTEKVAFDRLHLQPNGPNGSKIRPPRIHIANNVDKDGAPAGGYVEGIGLRIDWQNGPLGTGNQRRAPMGAFVETVIEAAKQRLEHYQESKFVCEENAVAINHLTAALEALHSRTAARESRGVEGTLEV